MPPKLSALPWLGWPLTAAAAGLWFALPASPEAAMAAVLAAMLAKDLALHLAARRERALRRAVEELERAAARLGGEAARLDAASATDPLTGLGNRKRLEAALAARIAESAVARRPFALLMLDIDHFKRYNDTLGHPAGDALLRELAAVMRRVLREDDTVSRYGGEEFAAILPGAGREQALAAAERLRAAVEGHPFPGGKITVSVGVAVCPEDGLTAEDLVAAADGALYAAKRAGRNRVAPAGAASRRD